MEELNILPEEEIKPIILHPARSLPRQLLDPKAKRAAVLNLPLALKNQ